MNPCHIDIEASPRYRRFLEKLEKKYRHVEDDTADGFAEIARDYKAACHATRVPKLGAEIWKYRIGSRDMNRGQRGGFRIIAFLDQAEAPPTLRPFIIYTHDDYPSNPPTKLLVDLIKEAMR